MTMFLQGRAIVFGVEHIGNDGVPIEFDSKSCDHLDGQTVPIWFNHEFAIGQGRLRKMQNGLWFEAEISGDELEAVQALFKRGEIRGASYQMHGQASQKMTPHGAVNRVHRVNHLVECGPVRKPAEILTSCKLSSESLFPVAHKRQRIELRTMPKAMVNGMRALAAMQAGEGCVLNGRTIGHGALVTMFQNRGQMAIY